MGNRDENHATLVRCLEDHGATVLDLHRRGDGWMDVLVGFCGRDQLVEFKRPPRAGGRRGVRSTKCGACGHEWKKHRGVECLHRGGCGCVKFVPDVGDLKRPGGVVDRRQKKRAREWRGSPPVVIETEEEAIALLHRMEMDR